MPKTKEKKNTTTTKRFWVVKHTGLYGSDYLVFKTKPRKLTVPGRRDRYGNVSADSTMWRDRTNDAYIFEMCDSGFENATGVTLEEGVPARLTISVESR